ncbi:hypothetical protein [Microbacterium pumilum]|uniref:Fibronectin type-III domain-containing protein n=1 Tax=Microbacterium pumilum TaxID=344165 RepID=A0ABN2T100_9MICO
MSYLVDPQVFAAKGGIIDWTAVSRQHLKADPAASIAERRKLAGAGSIQLRWGFDPALGYPIEPFVVWAKAPGKSDRKVGFSRTPFGIVLSEPCDDLTLQVTAGGAGLVIAYPSMPLGGVVVAMRAVPAGATQVRITGPAIRSLLVSGAITVDDVTAPVDLADDPNWRQVEIVGLPSAGITAAHTDLSAPQGLVSDPLLAPPDAALDRFRRGAPFYGWQDEIAAGIPITPWELADPVAMIKVFNDAMLPDFADMASSAFGSGQMLREYQRPMVVPTGTQTADAKFNPLRILVYGGISDPLAALVLGLGTAYPWAARDNFTLAAVFVPSTPPDFMITGTFLDDVGNKVERACFVLSPQLLLPPPTPGGLAATSSGVQSPAALDGPYRPVVTITWNQPPPLIDFGIGSHAYARRATNPVRPAEMLLDRRVDDSALQPIGAARNADTPAVRSLADTTWPIDPTITPNSLRYSVANQDIFGLWSGWSESGINVAEPPVSRVTLTAARLDSPRPGVPTPQGPVPSSLQFDLTWNWTSRSPHTITVVARRYAQVKASDPPANLTPPTSDTFIAGGEGALLTLHFDPLGAIVAATPGAGLAASTVHLTVDGQHTSPVPLQDRSTRRYRVTVTGFSLDFASTARWGLGLWARGQEHIAPQRTSEWNTVTVLSAADPRPPVLSTSFDNVTLASMRDGEGLHHARLEWGAMGGAVAYQVYTASEATLRAHYGMPEQRASDTLTQRLTALQVAFGANPDRRPWTRTSKDPITETSVQVKLPRGTKEIQCYLVIGVSAGNVESEWPTTADPLCGKRFVGFAAPVVVTPPPPSLEVGQGVNQAVSPAAYFATVRVGCDNGAMISRIDLYRTRVADAAARVETMGPPHETITTTTPAYTITGSAGHPILRVSGTDTVDQGSWKPVYYRAVAWSADDPTRGQYAGRSAPSVPRSVVVPPSGPPNLGSPVAVLPTPGSALTRIDLTTTAPVPDTVLGPHRLAADAQLIAADGSVTEVALTPGSAALSALPLAQPGAGASGLWRDETAAGSTSLHLLVRRTDAAARIAVRVRITDPLGRITEKVIEVPPVPADTPPDITSPQVDALTGGWVLSFATSVPDSTTAGDYRLKVALKRRGIAAPATVDVSLGDIPLPPRPPRTLFTSPTPTIPVAATRRAARTRTIGIGFRAAGKATVQLVAPDGTTTTLTRTIGPLL